MYIAIAVVYFLLLFFLLRGKSKKTIHTVLTIILFLNFSLHFIKQFFEPYKSNFPTSIRRSTVENICAVSTVFFPFIYLFKKQNVLHDYVFFIGLCGGFGALFYPTEALNFSPFTFDTIRFYICHINLVVIPLLAAVLSVYRPRLKKFWAIPLLFLVQEAIICLNEIFLMKVGLVDSTWKEFLDRGVRNNSFVFGVIPDFDVLKPLFDALTPKFLRTDAFHINGGTDFYFPVLWLIVPAFVFLTPVYIILSAPFWITDLVRKKREKRQTLKA